MDTRASIMKNRIREAGFVVTNQGNPKAIRFTGRCTLDEAQGAIEPPPGFVIRKDGGQFVAVDIRK